MPRVTMRDLLAAGVHFGRQAHRLNPRMQPFVLVERNGVSILDVSKTLSGLDRACDFVRQVAARGGTVLFIGSRPSARAVIAQQAERVGQPFVAGAWSDGLLSGDPDIGDRRRRLAELRALQAGGWVGVATRTEQLDLTMELLELERALGGAAELSAVPDAVWIVDTEVEQQAVAEARAIGVPIVAIVNSHSDPDSVDYPVPGNDAAIRSVTLLTTAIADAVADGRQGQV